MKRTLRRILVAAVTVFVPVVGAGAQASGTITGRVTDRATQQPIPDAQVLIVGATRGARTSDGGQYRLASVPVGTVRIRVIRLGYEAETRSVIAWATCVVSCASTRARRAPCSRQANSTRVGTMGLT